MAQNIIVSTTPSSSGLPSFMFIVSSQVMVISASAPAITKAPCVNLLTMVLPAFMNFNAKPVLTMEDTMLVMMEMLWMLVVAAAGEGGGGGGSGCASAL
jgi:hypothetical protein